MLRTAVRRRSCTSSGRKPAALHAFDYAFRKSPAETPARRSPASAPCAAVTTPWELEQWSTCGETPADQGNASSGAAGLRAGAFAAWTRRRRPQAATPAEALGTGRGLAPERGARRGLGLSGAKRRPGRDGQGWSRAAGVRASASGCSRACASASLRRSAAPSCRPAARPG